MNQFCYGLCFPEFDTCDLDGWWGKVEIVLELNRISSSEDKFNVIAEVFRFQAWSNVQGIVEQIKVEKPVDPYQLLKTEVNQYWARERTQRVALAFMNRNFLDSRMRPSIYLERLNVLWETVTVADVIRHVFLSKLPTRLFLKLCGDDLTLDDLGRLADQYFAADGSLLF